MAPKRVRDLASIRTEAVRVRVTASELFEINTKAKSFGLTTSNYLRNLSLNYPVNSIIDAQAMSALLKTSGDLGRLGGLFKLWLSKNADDKDRFSKERDYKDIDILVDEIEGLQKVLKREALRIIEAK